MQYTEAQQQDLMLLRRLFYGKLGVLARERKESLRRVPLEAAMTDHEVNSRLAEVVATAQELRDITAAEFQAKLQFTSAYRRGVNLHCLKSSPPQSCTTPLTPPLTPPLPFHPWPLEPSFKLSCLKLSGSFILWLIGSTCHPEMGCLVKYIDHYTWMSKGNCSIEPLCQKFFCMVLPV